MGNGEQGKRYDDRSGNENEPIKIGTDTDWKAVYTGRDHSLALKNNGTLYARGAMYKTGSVKYLGIDSNIPTPVPHP